jgi:hypothetical protein
MKTKSSGIKLNIAGAFTFNWQIFFMKTSLHKKINISLYDGVNNCCWNGGRINRDIHIVSDDIVKYNKMGISVGMAFSNPEIDLNDEVGNQLLEWMDESQKKYNVKNSITLINEDFRRFLIQKYNFELKYSITGHDLNAFPKTEEEINGTKKYYRDLEEKYDIIIPKMEHAFGNYTTDNSKYELMTNDTCKPNCEFYKEHFEAISLINIKNKNEDSAYDFDIKAARDVEECWLPRFNPNKEIYGERFGMDFNKDMINSAIEKGFLRFKISGRENKFDDIRHDLEIFL